ncbi:MAG: cryptochrome/photolyase family protein [Solirubrobacterales bacterium]
MALVWFRRDLRLHDNPALTRALRESGVVLCAFCFESALLRGRHASGRRNAYLLACVSELGASIRDRGGQLAVRHGDAAVEIPRLAAEAGAAKVHWNRDHTAHARCRDERVAAALSASGVGVEASAGVTCVDPALVRNRAGEPYRLFTPFFRAWLEAPRRVVHRAPRQISAPAGIRAGRPPSGDAVGASTTAAAVARAAGPGERAARRLLSASLRRVDDYERVRDQLDLDATTRLSIPMHFGCLSPREIEARVARRSSPDAKAVRRQLAWRDFWLSVIDAWPGNREQEHDARFRGFRWRRDTRSLKAWKRGETGYPLVDAGMRQLEAEGWMHNRARMVVSSFLTKNLLIDWRLGEAHFMRLLLDGDEAQNNGNWQWAASVGVDAQPYFRIFNPVRQQGRFDPTADYVRRWVPELRAMGEDWIARPWLAPIGVQRDGGCVVGTDYPEPIVDLAASAESARRRLKAYAKRRE